MAAEEKQETNTGEQPVEPVAMNRAERRAAAQGKPATGPGPGLGHGTGGPGGGRHASANVPPHKRGTLRRKVGDG